MANFVLLVDPNPERRRRFTATVEPELPLVEGLSSCRCESGDFCCLWAAPERAACSHRADENGAAVVWGEPIEGDSDKRIDAEQLASRWNHQEAKTIEAFDGFHASCLYHPQRGLTVGSDILGLFPIYYYGDDEVLLVGSSPELFRHHPAFRPQLNPPALISILLLGHPLEGETLWQDVRRLEARNVLRWQAGKKPKELLQFALPLSKRYFDLPFSAHIDLLSESLEQAVKRHVPSGRSYGMLLSGGLDSRMLGGFMRERQLDVTALTIGQATDLEAECARCVAKELGFRQQFSKVNCEAFGEGALLQAKWMHLNHSFALVHDWPLLKPIKRLPSPVVMGFMLDCVINARSIEQSFDPEVQAPTFRKMFAILNCFAFQPEVVRRLVRTAELKDLVDATLGRIRRIYNSYSDYEFQRVWAFCLNHRSRFLAGCAPWDFSFAGTSITPAVDRRLVTLGAGLPAASLAERRLQKESCIQRLPDLAALPLDRNTYNAEPLKPRLRYLLRQYLQRKINRLVGRRGAQSAGQGLERRYYYRLFDFENPGWKAVRRLAESHREAVEDLLDRRVLDELLPSPDVRIPVRNPIAETEGLKTLVGLILWAKDHL